MNILLTRKDFRDDGIFGELISSYGEVIAVTLEHSYDGKPKLPVGEYTCKRGEHRLESMEHPFTTFEICGVDGHSGILFHVGNYNEDSSGCVLLGSMIGNKINGGKMLMNSKNTFEAFMKKLEGIDSFTLKVE